MKAGSLTVDSLAGFIKGTAGALSGRTADEALTDLGIGQVWTTPAFDAANFTALSPMTWTVESDDVITYSYTIIGKQMTVVFTLSSTVLGGTAGTVISIKIPASKVSTKNIIGMSPIINDGAQVAAYAQVVPTGTIINIYKLGGLSYNLGNFGIYGQLTFEIN